MSDEQRQGANRAQARFAEGRVARSNVEQARGLARLLDEAVSALAAENEELGRQVRMLKHQLGDALDAVHELRAKNIELEAVCAELRQLTGGGR